MLFRSVNKRFTDLFSEDVLNIVFDELRVGLTVIDERGDVIYFNALAKSLLDWKDGSSGNSVLDCHKQEHQHSVVKKISSNIRKEWHRIIQREDKFIENIYLPLNLSNEERGIIIITRDVTGREQTRNRLQRAAITDAQTGLYNRRYFDILYSEILKKREMFSAIMLDVNGLKFINDNFGHEAGDSIIVEASRVISESVRESDYVFRYGGDEFLVILFTDTQDACDAIKVLLNEHAARTLAERKAAKAALRLCAHGNRRDAQNQNSQKCSESFHQSLCHVRLPFVCGNSIAFRSLPPISRLAS